MDPFNNILEPARQKRWGDVRLAEKFGWSSNGGVANPSDHELKEFLTSLEQIAKGGSKEALRIAQSRMLLVRHGGLFHGYHRNTLRYQTALRAVDPDCISQGAFGFCGPAAVAYEFAKRSPALYAACVFDLHNCEQGSLALHDTGQHLTLNTDKNCQTKFNRVVGMGPADFLILHAIRRAAENQNVSSFDLTNPGKESAKHATPPAKMRELLVSAGYQNVANKTFCCDPVTAPGATVDLDTKIAECQTVTTRSEGPVVIMLTHPWLAVAAVSGGLAWNNFDFNNQAGNSEGKGRKTPRGLHELHWICINHLQRNGLNIQMRFMSWGNSCWFNYVYSDFRQCYYGYVSGDP